MAYSLMPIAYSYMPIAGKIKFILPINLRERYLFGLV